MLVFGNISEIELIAVISKLKSTDISGFPIAATLLKISRQNLLYAF